MTTTQATPTAPFPIVVGFDGSPLAERALIDALKLAEHTPGAELHVVVVTQTVIDGVGVPGFAAGSVPGFVSAGSEEATRKVTEQRVSSLLEEYRKKGGSPPDRLAIYVLNEVPTVPPGRLIVDVAKSLDAAMIVVGTHGRSGLSRLVMGSVASDVVAHAECTVLVVRPPDFVRGEKVPDIEPPLQPGQPHLRRFAHRRTYHYVQVGANASERLLPVA